jgi:FkbM family methyltransferase
VAVEERHEERRRPIVHVDVSAPVVERLGNPDRRRSALCAVTEGIAYLRSLLVAMVSARAVSDPTLQCRAEVAVLERRSFLAGSLIGAVGTGVLGVGAMAWRQGQRQEGRVSYAQMGEDLVLYCLLRDGMKIERPTYVDIGAADPIDTSNTYLLHQSGGHGVLVEPNPAYQERLHLHRPHDVILEAGVGVTDESKAEYYVIRDAPMRNTFSRDDVELLRKRVGHDVIERVMTMPLISINRVIAEHLGAAPDLLSTDVEGLDLAILRTLDFEKYRPAVVIAETQPRGPIPTFLGSKGYEIRGATMYNTIFADPARYRRG